MGFAEWYNEHESLDKVEFEKELEIYKNDAIANLGKSFGKKAVYIVNAGRMNHGKSSLFNSLLGHEEFKVKDVRTTVKNKEVKWKDNIILVDTPGLDAVDEDTDKAYEAYYKADLIFFVHTVRAGELHDSEIKAIKKISQNFNKAYFWNHFCLVLSFIESVDGESLEAIKRESINAIKKECDADEFEVFAVSNSRYIKGVTENKKGLINRSGILELLDYIDGKVDDWYTESLDKNEYVLKDNLEKLYDEVRNVLETPREDSTNNEDNSIDSGKSIDELREIVDNFELELDNLRNKQKQRTKETFSLINKTKELSDKGLDLSLDGRYSEANKLDRERERIEAELDKREREDDMLIQEIDDKKDEAQLTCVKLGILDETSGFNYSLVMENIDNLASKTKDSGRKIEYVRNFSKELERIGKSDNLMLLVKNNSLRKYLRELASLVELTNADWIKSDEKLILDKIQHNEGNHVNDKQLQESLNGVYCTASDFSKMLRSTISEKIEKIDSVIADYKQEADGWNKKICAVIDEDAFEKEFCEIRNKMNRAVENCEFEKFERLNALYDQRNKEFRRLLEERTAMLDKATKHFRKQGVLNKADKFYSNTIYEHIDKFEESLYEENVSELQEKLNKIVNGIRSVKAIGKLVGINVAE